MSGLDLPEHKIMSDDRRPSYLEDGKTALFIITRHANLIPVYWILPRQRTGSIHYEH